MSLVLTLREDEEILIGDAIVKCAKINGSPDKRKYKIVIDAPKDVKVLRMGMLSKEAFEDRGNR
jgi:sRNA-binding carbon storage regulator CsrA